MSNIYCRMLISFVLLVINGLILCCSEAVIDRIPVEHVDGKCVLPGSEETLLESGEDYYIDFSCAEVTCLQESDGSYILEYKHCDDTPPPDKNGQNCVLEETSTESYPDCCPKYQCHPKSKAKMIEKRQEDQSDLDTDSKKKDLHEYAAYFFLFCMRWSWDSWNGKYDVDIPEEKLQFLMRLKRQEEELREENSYELPEEELEKEAKKLEKRFEIFSSTFDKCDELAQGLIEDGANSGKDTYPKLSASEKLLLHEMMSCLVLHFSDDSSEVESHESKEKIISLLSRRKRQSVNEPSSDRLRKLFVSLNICFAEPPKSEPESADIERRNIAKAVRTKSGRRKLMDKFGKSLRINWGF